MSTYGQELIKIVKLYIKQLKKAQKKAKKLNVPIDSTAAWDLKPLKDLLEETPTYNRRDYTYFLDELIGIIEMYSCHHPEESVENISDDKQKCKVCGFVRYAHWVNDSEENSMFNSATKSWGLWRKPL